jgi:hypothetical protein
LELDPAMIAEIRRAHFCRCYYQIILRRTQRPITAIWIDEEVMLQLC